MMKKIITVFFVLISISNATAQTIHVFDKTSGTPISDVGIVNFSESHATITDENGNASMRGFSAKDSILFQHTSYQSIMLTVKELEALDYKVAMYPSVIRLAETVISANRWEQKRKEVPMKIEVLSPDEISKMEAQTSADMLSG